MCIESNSLTISGFRSIEQHNDHGKGSEKPTTTGSAKLKAKHSAVIDIKSLADTLVYFSRKDRMSLSIFKKKNAGLKGEEVRIINSDTTKT